MQLDLLTGMNRALDYIEAHMTEPLKTEDIARQAYLSPFIGYSGSFAGVHWANIYAAGV